MSNYFKEHALVGKAPLERAAFSDRQAYLCAEMSRLAYFGFEGGHSLDQIKAAAKAIVGDAPRYDELEGKLEKMLLGDHRLAQDAKSALEQILVTAGFELVQTYDCEGTQAFLCTRGVASSHGVHKRIGYLVFRGTEPTDMRDLMADAKAKLVVPNKDQSTKQASAEDAGVRVHQGFRDALSVVQDEIQRDVSQASCDQLIISGHSLGGALAILYTRAFASDINGACYTFGAPPVGTASVQDVIKTPVYQIINENDIVPRLPNPWLAAGLRGLAWGLSLALKLSATVLRPLVKHYLDDKAVQITRELLKFRHPGYVSYLVGQDADARLRYNLTGYDKLGMWVKLLWRSKGFFSFRKVVSDHSIQVYAHKLRAHALRRNPC